MPREVDSEQILVSHEEHLSRKRFAYAIYVWDFSPDLTIFMATGSRTSMKTVMPIEELHLATLIWDQQQPSWFATSFVRSIQRTVIKSSSMPSRLEFPVYCCCSMSVRNSPSTRNPNFARLLAWSQSRDSALRCLSEHRLHVGRSKIALLSILLWQMRFSEPQIDHP